MSFVLPRRQAGSSLLVGALCALMSARAHAQASSATRSDDNACLGFSFGTWTPALDWQGAGHGPRPNPKSLQHAPEGRDWATDLSQDSADSALVLFPAWWPAGVVVRLPKRMPEPGDTLRGRATALVADGRRQAPVAEVRAWRVPCHKSDSTTMPPRP